jgi:hypothetical protein
MNRTLFDLLKKVSDKAGKELVNQQFVDKIVAQLVHPFETLTRNSSILSCIIGYPFLFPHEVRFLAVYVASCRSCVIMLLANFAFCGYSDRILKLILSSR